MRKISLIAPNSILIVEMSIYRRSSNVANEWLLWALIISSAISRVVSSVSGVHSGREVLINRWRVPHRSIVSVILVPSLKIFFLLYSWVNVTFFSAVLSFSIRFTSQLRIFLRYQHGICPFVRQLLQNHAAFGRPFWFGSVGRENLSTVLTQGSCNSDHRCFISSPKVAVWALVYSSLFKKLKET